MVPGFFAVVLLESNALGGKIPHPLDTTVEFQAVPPVGVVVPAKVASTAAERYWAPPGSLAAGTGLVAIVRLDTANTSDVITAKASQEKRRIEVEVAKRHWVGPVRAVSAYTPYVEVALGALEGGSYQLVISEQEGEAGPTANTALRPHLHIEQVFQIQGPEGAGQSRALEARVERGPMPRRILITGAKDGSLRVDDKLSARISLDSVGAGDKVTAKADCVDESIRVRIETVRGRVGAPPEAARIPWVVVQLDTPQVGTHQIDVWETIHDRDNPGDPDSISEQHASQAFTVIGKAQSGP